MYEINGDFGSVRLCRKGIAVPSFETPFSFYDGGWHHCRDLYHIRRPEGLFGYMLFFSVSEGGRIQMKNETYEIPANSVAIIPPLISHEYYTEKEQWWEFYWIHIGEECENILKKIIECQGYVFKTSQIRKCAILLKSFLQTDL